MQSASLPGRVKLSSPPLRWTSSRALRAASRGARRREALLDDPLGRLRVLLQEGAERLVDDRLHRARDLGVAELALGLPLELRLGQLDRDDRRQTLAHVLAGERLVGP